MLSRLIPDKYLVAMICSVILASLFPMDRQSSTFFEYIIVLVIALLFFLHGAKLEPKMVLAGMTHWRLHIFIFATTFIVFPLLGLALGIFSPAIIKPEIYAGIIFLCILPSTVQSSIAFTSIAGGNVPAAVCSATASNILGIFITPLLASLLLQHQGGGVSFDTVKAIMLQILLPFVLGQVARPYLGSYLDRNKKVVGYVDRGSILLVIYASFSDAVQSGLWQHTSLEDILLICLVSCILLFIVFCFTIYGSRVLGFSRPDEITIAFCGSKKTLASGIPMATVIFAGQNIGTIILPIMLFHQIQLMVCVFLANSYSKKTQGETSDGGY